MTVKRGENQLTRSSENEPKSMVSQMKGGILRIRWVPMLESNHVSWCVKLALHDRREEIDQRGGRTTSISQHENSSVF